MTQIETLRQLLSSRYPELAGEKMIADETAWNNLVIVVGGKLIFRFPITEEAKAIISLEQQILPDLRAALPLEIPHFLYSSQPSDELKYVGYPRIKGDSLFPEALEQLTENEREQAAKAIAEFLTSLHAYPVEKAYGETFDTSATKAYYEDFLGLIQKKAFPYLDAKLQKWTHKVFRRFLMDKGSFQYVPCLLHNDLKPEHFLYDFEQKKLIGVIDFDAIGVGDPAYDFVGLYRAYRESFTKQVMGHYQGRIDSDFSKRITSFYTKIINFWTLFYGIDTQNEEFIQEGLEKLRASAKSGYL